MDLTLDSPAETVDETLHIRAMKSFEPKFALVHDPIVVGIAHEPNIRWLGDDDAIAPTRNRRGPTESSDKRLTSIHATVPIHIFEPGNSTQSIGFLLAVIAHLNHPEACPRIETKGNWVRDQRLRGNQFNPISGSVSNACKAAAGLRGAIRGNRSA